VEEEKSDAGDSCGSGLANFPEDAVARLHQLIATLPTPVRETITGSLFSFACMEDVQLLEALPVRLDRYFAQVAKRPGLAKLFRTKGEWLAPFCRGLVQSGMLADLLAHHPGLVEGITTGASSYQEDVAWCFRSEELLARAETYEDCMEWLRRLKNERVLQLALADLNGSLDHAQLELGLSTLAEFVLRHTFLRIAGYLKLDPDLPLTVLGMGRLGSGEMSYLSDLDLVYVYKPRPGEAEDKIPENVIRLIQRFMRMLSTPLQDGPGYAVDARLRPTGNYGPLVVTARNWLDYYTNEADIWELQALLRVKPVAGDVRLGAWIRERANELCHSKRNPDPVWERICHLRQRMQRERTEERPDLVDIKLGMGGLVDIEFLVQGVQLIEGYRHESLRAPSVRTALGAALDVLETPPKKHRELVTAFQTLRSLDHRLRLHTNMTGSRITPGQFESLKAIGLWPVSSNGNPIETWPELVRLRQRVRNALLPFCPGLQ
jgi:[glutamine synthetase] adenylyltransferase / [glutamine synthetase]-adenylyl-L-tyrosine phosphorylase